MGQVGTFQVGTVKLGAVKVSTNQVGFGQVGTLEVCAGQVFTRQVFTRQVFTMRSRFQFIVHVYLRLTDGRFGATTSLRQNQVLLVPLIISPVQIHSTRPWFRSA